MASVVDICNLALSNADAEGDITELDPTLGEEERQCAKFYTPLRQQVLAAHPWGFATKQVALTLTNLTPVDTRWAYAYQYPSDCFKFRRILNVADPNIPISYKVIRDETERRVILANEKNALGEYTIDVTDPGEFDPIFVTALAWLLAAHIGKPLTGDDSIRDHALGMYQRIMGPLSRAKDAEEGHDPRDGEASWISARS